VKTLRQQQKYAGIYLRLSRDDGGDSESNSISNQREMLLSYCKQNLLPIYSEYVDDGVSGTTLQRGT
jgi:DNA invertase Pin-like site-specific DNA recombinase